MVCLVLVSTTRNPSSPLQLVPVFMNMVQAHDLKCYLSLHQHNFSGTYERRMDNCWLEVNQSTEDLQNRQPYVLFRVTSWLEESSDFQTTGAGCSSFRSESAVG